MQALRNFPKTHLLAVSALTAVIGVTLLLSPSSEVEANRIAIPIPVATDFPESTSNNLSPSETLALISTLDQTTDEAVAEIEADDNLPSAVTTNAPVTANNDVQPHPAQNATPKPADATPSLTATPKEHWKTFTVSSGDTLSAMFNKAGFDNTLLYEVLNGAKQNKELANLYVGEKIAFLSNGGTLEKIRLERNELESLIVYRDDSGKYQNKVEARQPEAQLAYAEGIINSSLFLSGQKAGLPTALTMELANIFAWDIDFALDIRQGDKFNVIYEEHYIDGKKIGNGRILAASFTNQGTEYKAVYYVDSKGYGNYYTPTGDSMRKAFLRTPIDFARVSSHFNLNRKHPVLHTIRAHKGTDYAAGTGTPIKATGDGKVIFAGRKGGYGKVVILQHGESITTLYAHMSRYAKNIHTGQKVRQGQVVGYVGSTGLASGPHLHYEFRQNGVHKNPMTVKLPQAQPISGPEISRFKLATKEQLLKLKTFEESYQVATHQQ